MTPDELDALKALAQDAHPGPWEAAEYSPFSQEVYTNTERVGYVRTSANAAYIAAANPQTVLALIAEVERLHARDAIAAEVAASAMDRAALIARIELLELFIYDTVGVSEAMLYGGDGEAILRSVRANVEALKGETR